MKMKFAISVWLVLCLLTTLITLSVQQCTKEEFEAGARELVLNSIGSEATILSPSDVFINETYYNCLATSENIGTYTFMSVSLTYTLSRAPNTLREIRYVMRCIGGAWNRLAENNTALKSNETRTDCYRCTDTANNEEYCFPCDSSCTGLNQCYGPNATQCCSYNDDGNCVADCGMNREGNSSFHCVCSNFWTGDNCNNCSLNCENGGTPGANCSTCQCVPGYEGNTCAIDIDECISMPCQNGGTCTDGINSYNCTCVEGFSGTTCENGIDNCFSNPCQNGGTCVDDVDSYNCTCIDGFNGTNCENDIDDCSSNPCENGGTCADGINSYICDCALGYNGVKCEIDINDCASNPCQNGGSCTDGINAYSCACVAGYTGVDCDYINACSPNPCKNQGMCTNLFNDYNCTCDPMYTGHDCSDCAIPNCEECQLSDRSAIGECTKCAGVFVLDKGTCNDNCGILNCILCDKVDMRCIQCQEGYRESDRECSDSDTLSAGAIFGIILACIGGLLALIIIIAAIIFGLRRENRKSQQLIDATYQKQTDEIDLMDEDTKATEM